MYSYGWIALCRWSSQWPDWPLASNKMNYAKLYKDSSPTR